MSLWKGISRRLTHLRDPWLDGTEPLELRRGILDTIEEHIVPKAGGTQTFPYHRIRIWLRAENPEERRQREALVRGRWDLASEVQALLESYGVLPEDLQVDVEIVDWAATEFDGRPFLVRCENTLDIAPATKGRHLVLEVLRGAAEDQRYQFTGEGPIFLGRLREVIDSGGRLRRRNHIAFEQEDEENRTVSRLHARIVFDRGRAAFFLRDEGSSLGTRIHRGHRTVEVSGIDRRGVRLQNGDEISLGRVRLRVRLPVTLREVEDDEA